MSPEDAPVNSNTSRDGTRLTADPQRIIRSLTRFFLPKVRVGLQIEFATKMQVEIVVLEWIVDGARDKIEAWN